MVEHSSRAIKRQFSGAKIRFSSPINNAVQILALFALSNRCMTGRNLPSSAGEACNVTITYEVSSMTKNGEMNGPSHRF